MAMIVFIKKLDQTPPTQTARWPLMAGKTEQKDYVREMKD